MSENRMFALLLNLWRDVHYVEFYWGIELRKAFNPLLRRELIRIG